MNNLRYPSVHYLITKFTVSLVGLLCVLLISSVALAEDKKVSLSGKRPLGDISKTVFTPGDVPNHEMSQSMYPYEIASPDPDFNGVKTTNFTQSDSIAGTGTHRGYMLLPLKNGDSVYIRYEGSHKTIAKDGGAWETPFEGKLEFVSGTGKYKNIKGGTTYKGKTTPDGVAWDAVVDVQY
jgi:hypothetical protein